VLLDPNGSPMAIPADSILSMAWWVDFSNFFEGVGALGGGNIAIKAGKDVSNVDAVIPTQARAAGSMLVDPAGRSIQSLAKQSGISVANLLLINLSQLPLIQPSEGTMLTDGYGNSYAVRSGDTLQSIAANWDSLSAAPTPVGMTLGALLVANSDQLASLIPSTQIRLPMAASSSSLVETGGGNLSVTSSRDLNAGVFYVERGQGTLRAWGSITTDSTRDPFLPPLMNGGAVSSDPNAYLPSSLFLGKGGFDVSARGDVLLGPTGNVFLMPQSINNGLNTSYFSTYDASDVVRVSSLVGSVTLRQASGGYGFGGTIPGLQLWMSADITPVGSTLAVAGSQPWLRLNLNDISTFGTQMALQPSSLEVVSFGGGISFQGNYTASPSATGQISLLAAQSITGLTPNGVSPGAGNPWSASTINLSDANPATIPAPLSPMNDYQEVGSTKSPFNAFAFAESGSTIGFYGVLQAKQQLHDSNLLHLSDAQPVAIYSTDGDVADFTLFSPKKTQVFAGGNIADVGLYIQNLTASDTSIVSASGDIRLYDNQTLLQKVARAAGAGLNDPQRYNLSILQSGDLQVSGPGAMEVLAGGNIDLGNGANNSDGTGLGITSIGNARNPALPFQGADLAVSAGIDLPSGLSSVGGLGLDPFAIQILKGSLGETYLSELSSAMTYSGDPLPPNLSVADFAHNVGVLSDEERAKLELQLFYLVLRDAGRAYSNPDSPSYRSYLPGEQAIAAFFGNVGSTQSDISLWSRDVRTKSGGNISMLAPNGGISLSSYSSGSALTPPGIVTEHGGGIGIYTKNDVSIGIGRIFSLRGGDIMIWSDKGNIAAGSSAKTVATAPPTRVLIDPSSGNVQTDLAGLATGGGIGVLDTVAGIPPGNIDLIAVSGIIDAGDAGIRASGNINLAALAVKGGDNISSGGTTKGAPPAAAPPASAPAAANTASAANASAATTSKNAASSRETDQAPSIFSIDVLGYGGGDGDNEEGDQKKAANASVVPVQASL
jgi:filamentous hemagglutinin